MKLDVYMTLDTAYGDMMADLKELAIAEMKNKIVHNTTSTEYNPTFQFWRIYKERLKLMAEYKATRDEDEDEYND